MLGKFKDRVFVLVRLYTSSFNFLPPRSTRIACILAAGYEFTQRIFKECQKHHLLLDLGACMQCMIPPQYSGKHGTRPVTGSLQGMSSKYLS